LSDTHVYEPYTRALLGTDSHFFEVAVLKLRTVPIGTALSLRIPPSIMYALAGGSCRVSFRREGPAAVGHGDEAAHLGFRVLGLGFSVLGLGFSV